MGAGHLDELDHVEWDGIIFQKKVKYCVKRERGAGQAKMSVVY